MNHRMKRLASCLLVSLAGLGFTLPSFAAEIQTTIRSPETVSAGEPVTFNLTFSHPGTEVLGDIWGDAADRPSEMSVSFELGEDCQYFQESGKFHCNLNAPPENGVNSLNITVTTQRAGLLELRGHTKLRSQLTTWSSDPVRILPSGK